MKRLGISKVILLINSLLILTIFGSIYYLVKAKSETSSSAVSIGPSPTEIPSPTPSPTPTPSPNSTPTPTLKPTPKPTLPPAQTTTQSQGGFTCTLFLGYSQTNNWFDEAEGVMGSANFEMMYINGGAAYKWGDAGYDGWRVGKASPCAQNAQSPDRVVMDITHNQYLKPENVGSDPVGFMEGVIRKTVSMIKSKYPSARVIVLQPVVGGPNHTTCENANKNTESNTVRASFNHPTIHQAIDRVVNSSDIVRGYDSQVTACSDYEDTTGHLNGTGQRNVGQRIGSFYAGQ